MGGETGTILLFLEIFIVPLSCVVKGNCSFPFSNSVHKYEFPNLCQTSQLVLFEAIVVVTLCGSTHCASCAE